MSDRAEQLLQEAMRLSVTERAEVAAELLASIDGEPDSEVEVAWAAEIERRARRARGGQSSGRDWADVRADLEARLSEE